MVLASIWPLLLLGLPGGAAVTVFSVTGLVFTLPRCDDSIADEAASRVTNYPDNGIPLICCVVCGYFAGWRGLVVSVCRDSAFLSRTLAFAWMDGSLWCLAGTDSDVVEYFSFVAPVYQRATCFRSQLTPRQLTGLPAHYDQLQPLLPFPLFDPLALDVCCTPHPALGLCVCVS